MRPWLRKTLLSFPLSGVGLFLIYDGLQRTQPPPPPATYLGPFRLFALPFLWSEWGEARRAGRLREATEYGKWITFLLPGQWQLFLGFAWEIAYDLPASSEDPHTQASALVEALILLEEGMRVNPKVQKLPILAAFMIQDRILRKKNPALEKAFEEIVGNSPKKAFRAYLNRILAINPKKKLPDLRNEVANSFLVEARSLEKRKRLQEAASLLLRAAEILRPTDKERANLFRELAEALRTQNSIPKQLLLRLSKDPAYGK